MEKIKYTRLLDYILEILKSAKTNFPNSYVSLVSILKYFNQNLSIGDIQEIGRYLETRGWAKVVYFLGDVRAQITTTGLVNIEDKETEDFKKEFSEFLNEVTKDRDQNNLLIQIFHEQDTTDPKNKIVDLLNKVEKKIKDALGEIDLLKDVQVVKLELSKVTPDLKLIELKLNNLRNLTLISTELQELRDYLTSSN